VWEITLKQLQDKQFQVDEDTILYNLNVLKEYQQGKMSLIKILHMRKIKVLIITGDSNFNAQNSSRFNNEASSHLEETGFDIVYKVMRNFYQFKHLHREDSKNLGEERDDDCHSMFMENSFEDPFAMQERRNQ
jgi:hypothetical protein